MDLLVGNGEMFHTMGNDDKFAFADNHFMIAEAHAEGALHNEKEFVFEVMMVPNEFALELNSFHLAVIEFPDDTGVPVVLKLTEFFCQVNSLHGHRLKLLNGSNSGA
jgi:hypothetical protein